MAFLTLFITIPLTLAAVLFAAVNTQDVLVNIAFTKQAMELPLYMIALGMLGGGFLCGALFVWLHDQKVRLKCWRETKRADRLEKELEALQAKTGAEKHAPAPLTALPAITS